MKGAAYYNGGWLASNSRAKELHDKWRAQPNSANKKALDDHLKQVNESFKKLTYPSSQPS
jgi:hypothetical protein